jgi:hypothetical protein
MTFEQLKEVLAIPGMDENTAKTYMVQYLSTQKDVIPRILKILEEERRHNEDLISGLNLNLSRTTMHVINPKIATKDFILEETKKFYSDKETDIRTCFIVWPEEQDGYGNFKEKTSGCEVYRRY